MTDFASPLPLGAMPDRLVSFARSELFERTFREGMALVEETASYLDGPGRAASKRLSRNGALAYAAESLKLTTRLMQVASWLLVQKALRDGEITPAEAASEKYRLSGRPITDAEPVGGAEELPELLCGLIAQGATLYERVRRLDDSMYTEEGAAEPANPVSSQLARLRAAFGPA